MSTKKYPLNNFGDGVCQDLMKGAIKSVSDELGKDAHFLLFLNLIDRQNTEVLEDERLVYGGLSTMKSYLENKFPKANKLDNHWRFLENGKLKEKNGVVGGSLFEKLRDGKIGLNDLRIGDLKTYFKLDGNNKNPAFGNELQREEYPILAQYFDLSQDCYLPLPLILFGKINGVVFLISDVALKGILKHLGLRKKLIHSFRKYYERLYRKYGVATPDEHLTTILQEEFDYVSSNSFRERSDTNKFFTELKLLEDYENEYPEYFGRGETN